MTPPRRAPRSSRPGRARRPCRCSRPAVLLSLAPRHSAPRRAGHAAAAGARRPAARRRRDRAPHRPPATRSPASRRTRGCRAAKSAVHGTLPRRAAAPRSRLRRRQVAAATLTRRVTGRRRHGRCPSTRTKRTLNRNGHAHHERDDARRARAPLLRAPPGGPRRTTWRTPTRSGFKAERVFAALIGDAVPVGRHRHRPDGRGAQARPASRSTSRSAATASSWSTRPQGERLTRGGSFQPRRRGPDRGRRRATPSSARRARITVAGGDVDRRRRPARCAWTARRSAASAWRPCPPGTELTHAGANLFLPDPRRRPSRRAEPHRRSRAPWRTAT